MNFADYTNAWVKSEVLQGRIMIGIGILLVGALFAIWRSEHQVLKGAMIPVALLAVVFVGYGAYILQSRPAHGKQSIAAFAENPSQAVSDEITKHTNDNALGKTLMRWVYPGLILLAAGALFFIGAPYYRGVCIGCIVLFAGVYVMDSGFVMRSDAFIAYLEKLG